MPQQKSVVEPVTIEPVEFEASPTSETPEGRSLWEHFSEAPKFITDAARSASDWITEPTLATSPTGQGGLADIAHRTAAMSKGFVGGALEGASSLLSPLNILTGGAGALEGYAIKQGLKGTAQLANIANKVASAPMVVHGGKLILSPESTWGQRGQGLMEIAGGAAGLLHKLPEVYRPGAKIIAESIKTPALKTPEGKVVSESFEIPEGEVKATIKAPTAKSVVEPIPESFFERMAPEGKEVTPVGKKSLSKDLQGAKPRFNIRDTSYEPNFESDLDKALFIIAQKNPSKRDADYLKYVMDVTGMDEVAARAAGNDIRAKIKSIVSSNELGGAVDIPTIYGPAQTPTIANPRDIRLAFSRGRITREDAIKLLNTYYEDQRRRGAIIPKGIGENMTLTEPTPISQVNQPPTKTYEGPTYIFKKETDPAIIIKARKEGYELIGFTDKGDYRFRKVASAPVPVESKSPIAGPPKRPPIKETIVGEVPRDAEGNIDWTKVARGKQPAGPIIPTPEEAAKFGLEPGKPIVPKSVNVPAEARMAASSGPVTSTLAPEVIAPFEAAKINEVITLPADKSTTATVKQIVEMGFKIVGQDKAGDIVFRKIATRTKAPILEGEIGSQRATATVAKEQLGPLADVKRQSKWVEGFNLPRGLMASWDLSAPLRQGLGLIHKKEFYKALPTLWKSWGSESGFRAIQDEIANRALFKARIGRNGKPLPSFADDAGLKLTDLTDLTKREEAIMSTWAEKVPGVRASNRAYTAFLNKLRADTFESLVRDFKVFGVNAEANVPLARELAKFVNNATGRGSLGELEKSAVALNTLFFSPRLMASRLGMMAKGAGAVFSPETYVFSRPSVRREYLKSLLTIAAAGNTVTQLGRMAGGTVSADPTSSDFGKLKIGNVRVDPYGGFQQYIVAASRLLSGQVTSSTTGKEYDLYNPRKPYDPTFADIITRFGRGKLTPSLGFAWSLLSGGKEMSGQRMNLTTYNPMENAIAQRFIPILMQDLYEIGKEDPALAAVLAIPATTGMGVQIYGDTRHQGR